MRYGRGFNFADEFAKFHSFRDWLGFIVPAALLVAYFLWKATRDERSEDEKARDDNRKP